MNAIKIYDAAYRFGSEIGAEVCLRDDCMLSDEGAFIEATILAETRPEHERISVVVGFLDAYFEVQPTFDLN